MIANLWDKTGKVKIGELEFILDDGKSVEEERNGIFELRFNYPNEYPLADQLIEENIVEVKPNDDQELQKFRIYNTKKFLRNIITVFARHETFDLANDHVESINLENASCEYALNTLFRNSHFSKDYRGYSDIVNAQDYKIDNVNILNAIAGKEGSVIDTYGTGAEILRDGKNIHVLNKRGHDNGVTIEYGKNLTGFELNVDLTGLETRCGGFAKYKPDGREEEVVIKSDWIDSPFIDNFSHPYINTQGRRDYSDKFKDGVAPTKEALNKLCQDEFKINKRDIPANNYKINFIPLSKCVGYEGIEDKISLCDTVTIIDPRFNINTKAKVIKYKYDFIKERYISMELGEPRTTLGDIIGSGGGKGEQGPPGPPGKDGNVEDFPNSLPAIPILTTTVKGFASIDLSWTYEDKVYYTYEVYASKTRNFTPNTFDLIHEGQTSSFLFQVKPNETWYFRVCAKNTHGNRTDFSPQVTVTTNKADNFDEYFSSLAVGNLVANIFSADYMEAGIIKGNWIDARNLSVTNGNGKRTLDIDSFGDVHFMPRTLKILIDNKEENIVTESRFEANNESINMKFGKTGGTNEILNSKCTNSKDYMYTGGHTGSPVVDLHIRKPGIQFTVKPYGSAGGLQTSSWPVVEGEKHTLAFNYYFERGMENYCEIHFYTIKHEGFGVWPDVKKEAIPLSNSGSVNHTVTVPAKAKYMKIYIYTAYNGVSSDKYPYAHAYISELRCFKSEIAGPWVPASDEMYVSNIKFNGKGIEQTYNNEYKSRWGADALEFLTPNNVRKLAIDRSQICTYNFNDGNFLSYFGATQNASHSLIFGNALSTSRHCAFFDISHQPDAIDDSKPITNLNSYFRVNFFDYDDQVKGVHVNKYPMYIHQNLYIDNNAKVTQDLEVWGDILDHGNLDVKRIRCRSGIDMVNMSVENAYAIKFATGNGCLVKGDGKKLQLGGQSAGDAGGTRIGIADTYGNISDTIWISASNFVWNKADWNWGGRNIYDVNVYNAVYGFEVINNPTPNVFTMNRSSKSTFDEINVVKPSVFARDLIEYDSIGKLDVSNVTNKEDLMIDESNIDLAKIVTMLVDEVKQLKLEIKQLKGAV
ncbi:MAG: phage tail protein [Paeniclostridium sordellii]|nr:phage tail protein [Paeniclostridium sordellii]